MQIIHGTYTACIERTYGAEPTELTQNEEPLHIYVRTDIMRLARYTQYMEYRTIFTIQRMSRIWKGHTRGNFVDHLYEI